MSQGVCKKSPGRGIGTLVFGPGVFVWLSLSLLLWSFPPATRAQQSAAILGGETGLSDEPPLLVSAREQEPDPQSSGSIKGTIVDPKGNPVVGAEVKLTGETPSSAREMLSGEDGQFSFSNVAPGRFRLAITATDFARQTFSGTLHSGEAYVVPQVMMAVATAITEVQVFASQTELAEEQIKQEEQQRVLGVIPNFYVTYVPDAVPLTSKQKFKLAWKLSVDPVTFGIAGAAAGIEQAANQYSGFGQGAEGYGRRYGAAYGDAVIGTFIGSAILPSILKQDPRYFYKGTGSVRSRILYAMANAVICKGDNGHWQANYSSILGSFAASGISTLYYPSQPNEGMLVVENQLIGIGSTAAANILQEFVIKKITPNLPKHNQPNP